MGEKLRTKDIRRIYIQEVKHDLFRRSARTVFVLVLAIISVFLADAATNQELDKSNFNFRH